jgi:DNA repair protein SbcC/Rad50
MRILRLKLRGAIGIRKGLGIDEVEIDFTKFSPGLVALTGRNGSGKTTIMENLHPYRCMVSRDGSLQNHFFLKDSYRILEFEFDCKIYQSKILIDGLTGASEAYLFMNPPTENHPLNDGKLTTYDEAIEKLLGSQELFFNSVFSGQKSKGIAELKPADRRKLFYELLNLNSYEVYLERAKAELKNAELQLADVEGQIKAIDTSVNIEELEHSRDSLQEQIEELLNSIGTIENEIEEYSEVVKQIEIEIGNAEKRLEEQSGLLDEVASYEKTIKTISEEHNKKILRLNSDDDDNKKLIAKYERVLEDRDSINLGLKTSEEVTSKIALAKEHKNFLSNHNSELQIKSSKESELLHKKEKQLSDKRSELTVAENNLKSASKSLSDAQNGSELIGTVPCGDKESIISKYDFSSCQFLSNAFASQKNIPFFESELIRCRNQKILIESVINSQEKAIQSERNLFEENYKISNDQIQVDLTKVNNDIAFLEEEKSKLDTLDYPAQKKLLDDADVNIGLLFEKKNSSNSLREELNNYFQSQLDQINNSINLTNAKIDSTLTTQIQDLKYVLAGNQIQLKAKLTSKTTTIQKIDQYKIDLNTIALSIETAKKNELQLSFLNQAKENVQREIQEWTFLCKAFDKTGIPILKLENSGHEITILANELLSLFENKFRIVFETTSLTKDKKKTKETFDINIVEEDGVCEIGNKSGGQQVWLETAIQLAIMILLSSQGKKIETAFLDEKDGALDLENAYAYVEMLKKAHSMSGVYNTFVITHRTELLESIPQQVKLQNGILEVVN